MCPAPSFQRRAGRKPQEELGPNSRGDLVTLQGVVREHEFLRETGLQHIKKRTALKRGLDRPEDWLKG